MRVLAAVLADAGRIGADVAGVRLGADEGRGEQQQLLFLAAHQVFIHRGHRVRGARRVGSPGKHRPGLGNRVDAALRVARRAQRRAVVEVPAPVPVPVPAGALQRRAQRLAVRQPSAATRAVSPRAAASAPNCSSAAHRNQPSHTLSPRSGRAHEVHAVVPVTAAHQRQPVFADRQARIQRERAVLVDACRVARTPAARSSCRSPLRGWAHRSGTAPVSSRTARSPVART